LCAGFVALRSDAGFLASSNSDMGSFWASGWAAARGLDPYARYSIAPPDWTPSAGGEEAHFRNLNPPALLPAFELLSRVDPVAAARIDVVLSALLYVGWLTFLALGRRVALARLAAALLFSGFWFTLGLNQLYLLLFALAVGAESLLRRDRPVAAGVCIGLICTLRPPLLVWPALLVVAGGRRAGAAAGGIFSVAAALPVAIYGWQIYRQWLGALALEAIDPRVVNPQTASLAGLAAVLGGRTAELAVGGAILAGTALWVWRVRPSPASASRVMILASLLSAPVAWFNYLLVWLPFGLRQPRWGWPTWTAMALLAVPIVIPLRFIGSPLWLQATLGAPYVWATVLLLADELARPSLARATSARAEG